MSFFWWSVAALLVLIIGTVLVWRIPTHRRPTTLLSHAEDPSMGETLPSGLVQLEGTFPILQAASNLHPRAGAERGPVGFPELVGLQSRTGVPGLTYSVG